MKLYRQLKGTLVSWSAKTYFGVPVIVLVMLTVVYYTWLIVKIIEAERKLLNLNFTSVDKRTAELDVPYSSDKLCDIIHVVITCRHPRRVVPMLKSLLHHRQNPLHLHLLVDGGSERKMQTIFDTWDLPDVNYTCHTPNLEVPQVETNCSDEAVLVAFLVLAEIIPTTQVVVLNTDLTILCDIVELWDVFGNMSETQFIGLAKNFNSYNYTAASIFANYSEGVILLDLKKLRSQSWYILWHNFLTKNVNEGSFSTSNLSGIITKDTIYDISCQYNLQIMINNDAKNYCGYDPKKAKVSHILELHVQNYALIVLPKAFIVHTSHPLSPDRMEYKRDRRIHECITQLKNEFIRDLIVKYNVTHENIGITE